MESLQAYLPQDRLAALVRGATLPEYAQGAALFADISGFTPLTEALTQELGPRAGGEVLIDRLNQVYSDLIREVERYGGSIIGFSGDAVTCWFTGEAASWQAVASGLAMQAVMQQPAHMVNPSGQHLNLALKVAVTTGRVRRLVVGNPAIQLIEVLAGSTIERLAELEQQGRPGQLFVKESLAHRLNQEYQAKLTWLPGQAGQERLAAVTALFPPVTVPNQELQPTSSPLEADLPAAQLKPWLLPAIYERIVAGRGDFLTELRPAAALFLRFGRLDYDFDEQAGAKLNAYICWVQQALAYYEGTLIQLTTGDKGDYFYAVFGAPISHENDTERALEAALALQTPPAEFSWAGWVQIGISQGIIRAGAYGSPSRRTYGVQGDEVNLAARLMAKAAPGQILVSSPVQERAAGLFEWERLPSLSLKGKAQPVEVFSLVGRIRQNRPATFYLSAPAYALPMVGRRAELDMVREKLAQVLTGQGQILGLVGEAGIGKSRLLMEIIGLANEQGFEVYGGACQSYGINTGYLVWQSLWQAFFKLDPASAALEKIRQLEQELTELDPALVERLPLLGTVLNLPLADNTLTRALSGKIRKASLESLLVDCLRSRASSQPLLLVLEDCHWLDALSQDLLEALGHAVYNQPILIVLAYRPPDGEREPAPRVSRLPHFRAVELRELSQSEIKQLVSLKLQQTSLPDALVEQIAVRSEGNPFYIEELLNYLTDRGLLAEHKKLDWEKLELPDSLHRLVLSRVDQLAEGEKITLKVASVIGRVFKADWLWWVYPPVGAPTQVKTALVRLAHLGITPLELPEPELTYLFKHALIQEVTYQSVSQALRTTLHEQVGGYIEQYYAEEVDSYLDLLAYHYGRTANRTKQIEYYRRAAQAAQAAYANSKALEYYRSLLGLLDPASPEQWDIRLKLGEILELVGSWQAAGELYQQCLQDLEAQIDPALVARFQERRAMLLGKQGNYGPAVAELEQTLAKFERLGDRRAVNRVMIAIGETYQLQHEYVKARRYLEQGLALARVLEDKSAIAATLHNLSQIMRSQGDFAGARAAGEESLKLNREMDRLLAVAEALGDLGMVALTQDDYGLARSCLEESLLLRRKLGDKDGIAEALGGLGQFFVFSQDFTSAIRSFEEVLAIKRAVGNKAGMAEALGPMALACFGLGDYQTARAHLQAGIPIAMEINRKLNLALGMYHLGLGAGLTGQAQLGVRLMGASYKVLVEEFGYVIPQRLQAIIEPGRLNIRTQLGETAYQQAYAEGQAMPWEEAVQLALAIQYT